MKESALAIFAASTTYIFLKFIFKLLSIISKNNFYTSLSVASGFP
jgi:hypothetical protein